MSTKSPEALPVCRTSLLAGIVIGRMLQRENGAPIAGRMSLGEFVRNPDGPQQPLAAIGIDSLGWMGLLTTLESDLALFTEIEIADGMHVTAMELARAMRDALEREQADSVVREGGA